MARSVALSGSFRARITARDVMLYLILNFFTNPVEALKSSNPSIFFANVKAVLLINLSFILKFFDARSSNHLYN